MLDQATSPEPSFSGRLDLFPFPNLLYRLYRERATGTLVLETEDGRRHQVELHAGMPYAAKLVGESVEHLGRILLELGKIDDAAYQESLVAMAETKRLHGQILIEMGAITQKDLEKGLQAQIRRKLNRLFRLETGDFEFTPRDGVEPDVPPMDPLPLIFHGIHSAYEDERLARVLSPLVGLQVRIRSDLEDQTAQFQLRAVERQFLERLREFQPVSELLDGRVLSGLEARLLLASLLLTESLDVRDEVAAWKESPRASAGTGAQAAPEPKAPAATEDDEEFVHSITPPGAFPAGDAVPVSDTADEPSARASFVESTSPPVASQNPRAAPVTERSGPRSTAGEHRSPPAETVAPATTPSAEEQPTVTRVKASEILRRAESRAAARSEEKRRTVVRDDIESLLTDKEEQVEKSDFFGILEVKRDSDDTDLKRAYFQLAKRFHPDRFTFGDLRALRRRAEAVFERISEAYETLRNPERRVEYLKLLADDRVRGDRRRAQQVAQAEHQFQRAEDAMAQGDFGKAVDYLKRAVNLFPDDPVFHATLGWVTYKDPKTPVVRRFNDAVKHLLRALEIKADSERAHLFLGRIYEQEGKRSNARQHYARVAELSPSHPEARAAIARLERSGGDAT